jgi:hypothetical protein
MKYHHLVRFAVVTGFLLIGRLRGDVHQTPVYNSVVTTIELLNKPGTADEDVITVTWVAKPTCFSPDLNKQIPNAYVVTITRTKSSAAAFSLLTLGLQSVTRKNEIRNITLRQNTAMEFAKTQADVTNNNYVKPTLGLDGSTTWPIDATGTKAHPDNASKKIVKEDGISFVKLTGTRFTLEIVSYAGERIMKHDWNLICADADGHDNEPPKNPPD